jgi:hypothetical protein
VRLRTLIFSLMLLPLCPLPAAAAVVENLYQAVVTVKDHSAAELARGTSAGLGQVLVKLSGSREVLEDPEVREVLAEARSYMQQYQYRRPERDALELVCEFDPDLVTGILARTMLPLWTANRPPVLVWLVVDDANGRRLADRASHPRLTEVVEAEFQRRGVPVQFPLYDLEDTLAVSVHDLWQLDSLSIYTASRRYGSENVLAGRLRSLTGERWMGDWLYLWQDESRGATGYGDALGDFVSSGVHVAAEAMAARYSVAPTGNTGDGILVRVDGLRHFGDYRASLEYLETVELVERAVVEYADGETVVFRVNAQLQSEQLQRMIAFKKKLELREQFEPLEPGLPEAELVYQWNP